MYDFGRPCGSCQRTRIFLDEMSASQCTGVFEKESNRVRVHMARGMSENKVLLMTSFKVSF